MVFKIIKGAIFGPLSATSLTLRSTVTVVKILDEDDMISDSPFALATQQSIKAYVDSGDAGDVKGPASATDNAIARFDGITGKLIQNSGVLINDSNNVTGLGNLTFDEATNDLTLTVADQTVGISMANIPDLAGSTQDLVLTTQAQTLSGKTITAASNSVTARFLGTTGTDVDIDSTAPGGAGEALVSTSTTVATWQTLTVGDVVGPAGATNNAVARFDGITGKLIQNSGVLIDASNNVTGLGNLTFDEATNDLTLTVTDQTVGVSTANIPDLAGTTQDLVLTTQSQTLSGKTITAASNSVTARFLGTTGTDVDIDSTAPSGAGETLVSTSTTTATWQAAAGGGNVVGPAGAVDNSIATFDGVTGLLLQDADISISTSGGTTTFITTIAGNTLEMNTLTGTPNAGSVEINVGVGSGAGFGGNLGLNAGGGGTTGNGGSVDLFGGTGGATSGDGGAITVLAGDASTLGDGGILILESGSGSGVGGNGGDVELTAADASGTGGAGNVIITSGTSVGGSDGVISFIGPITGNLQTLVAAGAVSLTTVNTDIQAGAAIALTLADGTTGQLKILSMSVATGAATLTPTNLNGFTTITFNSVGDGVILMFDGTNWNVVANQGAALA